MPTLTILPSGKTIDAETGSRLLDAILAAGEKIVSKCGGEAKCGQCHVFVQEGRKSVSKMQRAENEKLDTHRRRRLEIASRLSGLVRQRQCHG